VALGADTRDEKGDWRVSWRGRTPQAAGVGGGRHVGCRVALGADTDEGSGVTGGCRGGVERRRRWESATVANVGEWELAC
jgi:hypothetical protein